LGKAGLTLFLHHDGEVFEGRRMSNPLFRSPTIRMLMVTSAVTAAAAVGTVLAIDGVSTHGLPQIAITRSDGSIVSFGGPVNPVKSMAKAADGKGVDMTAVGSINKVTIDPCTGKTK
jgi:hypothetical protein